MEEDQHAPQAPGNEDEHADQNRQRHTEQADEVFPVQAGEEKHHGGDAREDKRGAEIGLDKNQKDKESRDDKGAEEGALPVVDLVEARGEEPCQEDDQHGFGDLGGLDGEEAAEANPAVGIVRAGHEEDQHQQKGGDAESRIDEARRLIEVIVDARQNDEKRHAEQGPDGLLADEGVGGVIALLGYDGRGGEDHRQPDHDEQQGYEEEPLVSTDSLCHFVSSGAKARSYSGAHTARLKSCRKKKLLSAEAANDFIETSIFREFRTVPTGRGLLLNSDPGLRCACPGLIFLLPAGVKRWRFHPPVGRQRRWTTVTKPSPK